MKIIPPICWFCPFERIVGEMPFRHDHVCSHPSFSNRKKNKKTCPNPYLEKAREDCPVRNPKNKDAQEQLAEAYAIMPWLIPNYEEPPK
jgi:hypothetical protein